jgi:hypothetical protein
VNCASFSLCFFYFFSLSSWIISYWNWKWNDRQAIRNEINKAVLFCFFYLHFSNGQNF